MQKLDSLTHSFTLLFLCFHFEIRYSCCTYRCSPLLFLGCSGPVCHAARQRSPSGFGVSRHAHDRGAAPSVQPGAPHHDVSHPRVQVVPHAPAASHRPAVCLRDRCARLEEVKYIFSINKTAVT